MQPDKPQEDVPAYSGAVDLGDIGQDEQRRLKPPNGAKPKWPGHDMEPRRQPPDHWPNADRGQGLRRPLALISEKIRDCRARMGSCRRWGHGLNQTHLGRSCQK